MPKNDFFSDLVYAQGSNKPEQGPFTPPQIQAMLGKTSRMLAALIQALLNNGKLTVEEVEGIIREADQVSG